jgi:hypothetical protein
LRNGQMRIVANTVSFGTHPELSFNGLALDRDRLEGVQDELHVLLRTSRHLRPNQEDNFGLLASIHHRWLISRVEFSLCVVALLALQVVVERC